MPTSFHHGDTEARRFLRLEFWDGSDVLGSGLLEVHGSPPKARSPQLLRQRVHHFFEYPTPVLVALKLVEAGAGGREQNDISGLGGFAGTAEGIVQRLRGLDFNRVSNL